MKKILTCVMALLAAACLYATELNIYASGLKVHQTSSGATIDYMLNAPATSLVVNLYGPANTVTPAKTINLTGSNLDKGSHVGVAIDLTGLADAVYTWEIVASAETRANDEEISLTAVNVNYSQSHGILVDDNPNSPYFGTLYVAAGTGTKIIAASPDFATVSAIVQNAPEWSSSVSSPNRLFIGEDGLLYASDWSDNTPNITVIDRSNNTTSLIFGGTAGADGVVTNDAGETIHASIASCCVTGVGASRVLYTIDEDMLYNGKNAIYAYNIGRSASPWEERPSFVWYENAPKQIYTSNATMFPDGLGGLWVALYRWSDGASNPALMHINSSSVVDWTSSGTQILANGDNCTRGALFVNNDKSKVLTTWSNRVSIFDATYNGSTISTVSLNKTITASFAANNYCYAVSMDPAGNVFMLGPSNLMAYATAGSNTCATPAPSSETIALPLVEHLYEFGSNQATPFTPAQGIEMTKVSANVFEGTFTFANDNSFFAFASIQSANWTDVNNARYSGPSNDYFVGDDSIVALAYGIDRSFKINAGTYKFTVDLNVNKIEVHKVYEHLYVVGDNQGWNPAGTELDALGNNVFEDTLTFGQDPSYFAFATAVGDWDAVNANRYIASVNNELVDDETATTIQHATIDPTNANIKILPGMYKVTVDMSNKTLFVRQLKAGVAVTAAGYATYYNSKYAYKLPAGVEGYVFNEGLVKAYDPAAIVPAGTPLVLKADQDDYLLDFAIGGTAPATENKLRGTDVAATTTAPTADSYLFYGLSLAAAPNNTPESVGFYWMAENGAAFTNAAHKAYLALLQNYQAPERILFNNNGATDIKKVEGQDEVVKFIQDGKLFIQKNGVTYDALGRVVR